MIDGATNLFGNLMESLFRSNRDPESSDTSDEMQAESRWLPVDDVDNKTMSLYHCLGTHSMGIYYVNPVSSNRLEHCYLSIQEQPFGSDVARNLLEPFQSHQTGDMRRALLTPLTMTRFFNTLSKDDVATFDSREISPEEQEKLQKARTIFVRTQIDSHWYLTVITRVRPTVFSIHVLDSLNNVAHHEPLVLEAKNLIMRMSNGNPARIINEGQHSCLIPAQEGRIDSGVAIAYYAQKILQGESLDTYSEHHRRTCDYVQFRMHMAFQIAAHGKAAVPEAPASCVGSRTLTPHYASTKAAKKSEKYGDQTQPRRNRHIKVC